jgi:hypothetical protein
MPAAFGVDSQKQTSASHDDSDSSFGDSLPIDDDEDKDTKAATTEAVASAILMTPDTLAAVRAPDPPTPAPPDSSEETETSVHPKYEGGDSFDGDENSSFGDSLPIDDDDDSSNPSGVSFSALSVQSPAKASLRGEGAAAASLSTSPIKSPAAKPPPSPPLSPGSDAYSEDSFEDENGDAATAWSASRGNDEPNSSDVVAALERSRALRARVTGESSHGAAAPAAAAMRASESSLEEVGEMVESFDFDEEGSSECTEGPEGVSARAAAGSFADSGVANMSPAAAPGGDRPLDLSDSQEDEDELRGDAGKVAKIAKKAAATIPAHAAELSFEDQIAGAAFAIHSGLKGTVKSPALERRLREDGHRDGGRNESEGTNKEL